MEEKEVMAAAAETAESAQVTEQKNGSTEMDRVLTTRQLVVNGLAWLCPACIVMYYGIVNQMSGGAFPLVVLIAGVVMIFAAFGYANMGKKYIQGGSVYTYVRSEEFRV